MDFFERQDRARRSTRLLVVYFVMAVAFLTAAVYVAVLIVFSVTSHHGRYLGSPSVFEFWHPKLFAGVLVGTLSVVTIGSLGKTIELNQGGSVVASTLGGRLVSPTTSDPDERKLMNVVEEMAIASGVPVPQVYVLPQERAINAFAAGHMTSDAVVAVTFGAMKLLSRDELQGVLAHEFSHILNGDMRLNIRLMGAVFGILCLAIIGRVLLQTRFGNRRDRNPLPLLGLALVVIGSVGVFFGRLIQAAVSRQREFLADASAVQFTRNPQGLAGALKKIGGLGLGSRLQTSQADAASHMFFSNGMRGSLFGLMDTHPPLAQRILALDPAFDGVFPDTDALVARSFVSTPPPAFVGIAQPAQAPIGVPLPGFSQRPAIGPALVSAQAGAPTTTHLRYAADVRDNIPLSLRDAARESLGATTLVYALLLSEEASAQSKQLGELASATSPAVCQETLRLLPEIQNVACRGKLPLLDLCLPGLRLMSRLQFQQFSVAVKALVESDGEIDLFEYMLQKFVMRHLEPHYAGARKPVVQYYALKPLMGDCAVLLSELAYVGQSNLEEVTAAFQRGAQVLSAVAQVQISLIARAQCDLEQVDAALSRLTQAAPQIKKNILEACAQTAAADGVIQEMEAELLRAVADALDCPMPPLIGALIPQPV